MVSKQTQVYLTNAQKKQLKLIAVHEGTDVSKLVRGAVDALITQKEKSAHYADELKKIRTESECE